APQDKGYEDKFENVITNRTELERISELVMSMPPQRRRAFLLVKVDGQSQVEAAEKMGISRPAVTKHLSKALEAIMDESQRREENNE
ncbi:MAG: sigma factor-like helix-turn-helix DNA-binding protein, partial [Pseudomonadota bacterium]